VVEPDSAAAVALRAAIWPMALLLAACGRLGYEPSAGYTTSVPAADSSSDPMPATEAGLSDGPTAAPPDTSDGASPSGDTSDRSIAMNDAADTTTTIDRFDASDGSADSGTADSSGACSLVPCAPVALATSEADPWGIAVDGANVYWTNQRAGTVKKVPLSSGPSVTIAAAEVQPSGIAVDATHVYWVNYTQSGAVRRATLGGG
jgi:hypothetical protein